MNFEQALATGGLWALPLAALGGMMTALNPCCFALYPAVTATCCAAVDAQRSRMVASRALAFVTGTAFATTVLGLGAALVGHAIAPLGRWPRYGLAFVPILVGLHLLGWVLLPLPQGRSWTAGKGVRAAFAAGLLLSLVVGSCGTPVLAAILAVAAYQDSVLNGAMLLFVYGLGSGLPLLLVGVAAGSLSSRFASPEASKLVDRIAGAMLVALGFYLLLRA